MEDRVLLCEDGKYRWAYEYPMMQNFTIFWTVFKILGGSLLIPIIIITLSDLFNGLSLLEIGKNLLPFVLVFLGLAVLALFAYWIVSRMYNGKYCVMFEMDENGVDHIQMKEQVEKAQVLSAITALVRKKTGNLTTTGIGLNTMSHGNLYTFFEKVFLISANKRKNVIKVNAPFSFNQVYVPEEDFDFVLDYIKSHCPKIK